MPTTGWTLSEECPAAWPQWVERLGAGLFHTPAGLLVGGLPGRLVYTALTVDGAVAGLALGVRRTCRLGVGGRPRHVYFPTLPALDPGLDRDRALQALTQRLQREAAAEVFFDSFDAGWEPGSIAGSVPGRERFEYLISLSPNSEWPPPQLARTHLRHFRTGERNGWVLRRLEAEVAEQALRQTLVSAADRRFQLGQAMGISAVGRAAEPVPLSSPWGLGTFACYAGEILLGAILAGWGSRHGYYLSGGSTPEGYRHSSAVWLQCAVMRELAGSGCVRYNLGGTPATAERQEDPQHGLYRFKCGFGANVVHRRGVRWILSPRHQQAHRAVEWVSRWLGSKNREGE